MKRIMSGVLLVPIVVSLLLVSRISSIRAQGEDAVREVIVLNPDTLRFYRIGTAFHVGSGLFYTNAHVVRAKVPAGSTKWYLAGTSSTLSRDTWLGPASINCVHSRWREYGFDRAMPYDVAQLKVADIALPPTLSLDNRIPVTGAVVTVKGFASASRGWPPKLYTATGRVSEFFSFEQEFGIDIESGFALEGTSGSPVLNEAGHVIGMVHGRAGERGSGAAERVFAVTVAAISGCPLQ
jgi:S1-C subfamily serine protease